MRWTTLSANKTSDQLVEVLLNEITGSGGSDAAGAEYFDGMVSSQSSSSLEPL